MPDLSAYRRTVHAALAHLIKVSDEDLDHLAVLGATAMDRARHLQALALGAHGAWLLHRNGVQCFAQEAQPLPVADTVGVGDSFLAGLLAHLLRHSQPAGSGSFAQCVETRPDTACQQALRHALVGASLCVMVQGGVPPGWEAVVDWVHKHPAQMA